MNTWGIALLPLLGVLLGAGLQYLAGQALEERKHLRQLRAESYADYFKSVSALALQGRTKEAVTLLADAKSRICLYGSPIVIKKLAELERYGAHLSSNNAREAIISMVSEARKDTASSPKHLGTQDLSTVLFGLEPATEKPSRPRGDERRV